MVNKTVLLLAFFLCLIILYANAAAECPSFTKVTNCTPKCTHDTECSAVGGKCCANICNGRSCADPNVLDKYGDKNSKYNKNSGSGSGTGAYCGNNKCMPFEKCVMNRSTKRQECARG